MRRFVIRRRRLLHQPVAQPGAQSCWQQFGLAEILGEQLVDDVEKNVKNRIEVELNACKEKQALALLAKELGYNEIYSALHDMCKDEARHGQALEGVRKRYFFK